MGKELNTSGAADSGKRPKHLLHSLSTAVKRALTDDAAGEPLDDVIGMGTRLGPYTLEQKIGQGGMGAVYKARHDRLPRPVAVKLLRTKAAGDNSLELFEREVRQTSRLTHPCTVTIFDFGTTANGFLYYVMEYIDGFTLDNVVEQFGPMPAGRAVHIVAQLSHALAEAHGLGLVHRDIKPANVLLCDRGGVVDLPKLVDFGLVADLQAPIDPGDSAPRVLLGTPMFMAPEALAETHRVDARTDIYALGAVAYYMLTGFDIFEGAPDLDTLINQQLFDTPVSPSDRLGRKLPRDVEGLVMMCLKKRPADRPPSSLALRNALLECLDARNWGPREAEQWWAAHDLRPRRADGERMSGTPADDTARIPEWRTRTERLK